MKIVLDRLFVPSKKNIVLYFIKFFNRVMLCLNSHMLISSDKICRLSVIINVYRRSRNHCSLPFARNDLGRDAVHRRINSNKDMSGFFNE